MTPREVEVLQLIAKGNANKQIAGRLSLAEETVKVHVKGLLRKVKANNRTQLAIWALRQARLPHADAAIEST